MIDPVAEVAALAAERDISCHVDACMGGVTLPYLARLGQDVPPFDFAVEGVTSMSVDLHKFGYTAKGASVIVHRTRELRRYQVFVTERWLGGTYGSSGLLGTKSGGAIAAAWAVLHHLGDDGYLRLTRIARAATEALAVGIRAQPELVLRASRRRCCWRSARPIPTRSTCSPSPTRCGGGAGTSIAKVPRRRSTARSTPCTSTASPSS